MKDLIKAGKELNDLLFDDDEINVKGTKEEMETQIKEAAELIDPTKDTVSDETKAVLEELDVWPEEEGEKEGEKEPSDNLVDQINDAATMKELKIIAKDLDEFKSLRGILTKYKTKDDLREVMLEMLEEGEPEGKEEKPVAKKTEPAKKEPAPKKNVTAKEEKKPVEKKELVQKSKENELSQVKNMTYAQIFAQIFHEDVPRTTNELVDEMTKRYHSGSVAGAKTFVSLFTQILKELGLFEKNDKGQYIKSK